MSDPVNESASKRQEALPWLRLTLVPGLTPRMQQALLRAHGSPQAVLAAAADPLALGADPQVAQALAAGPDRALVDRTLAWLEAPGHHLLTLADSAYPQKLLGIHDPPTVLYAQGDLARLNAPAFAVVGSRNASAQGRHDAFAFAQALSSAGLCIVSGMALGIDAAAHRGGLASTGSSIAVVGTGADIVYPRDNHGLAAQLAERGCIVSEFALGTRSLAGNFPRRNRLISGMSLGVLVVEAGNPSGSLITARCALDQGRDVFAVPGSIHSPLSKGCHDLIKQGAKLTESADDILAEIGWRPQPAASEAAMQGSTHPLLEAIGFASASMDEIVQRTGLQVAQIAASLTRLEIEGRVAALPGGRFQRLAR